MLKRVVPVCVITLACVSASAQMPAPLLAEIPADSRLVAAQADAARQLETLLRCKPGTDFTADAVQSLFKTIGLIKIGIVSFIPAPHGSGASLFGDEMIAADVSDNRVDKNITVYFKNQSAKRLAKKLGATEISYDEDMTPAPSYTKETSQKTFIAVQPSGGAFLGNNRKATLFKSSVTCTVKI